MSVAAWGAGRRRGKLVGAGIEVAPEVAAVDQRMHRDVDGRGRKQERGDGWGVAVFFFRCTFSGKEKLARMPKTSGLGYRKRGRAVEGDVIKHHQKNDRRKSAGVEHGRGFFGC